MLLSRSNINDFPLWLDAAKTIGATILIDKDLKWTSFDVVAKIRTLTNIKKIGHAGTLDPLATGLLVICLGKATKTIEKYQNLVKEYIAEFKFGATTKTDDSEAEEENIQDISNITPELILEKSKKFIGEILQLPPRYSAKKINGKKMYELARKNKPIEIKPSRVHIFSIEFLIFSLPYAKLKIVCSKGTYIRSLARDLGNEIGCGAYLASLRRTKIGEFSANDALKIDEFANLFNSGKL
jgi:tRNA pseudouridine55 synthase